MKKYIERSAVMQKFADYVKRSNNSDFALIPTWNEAVLIVEECPTVDAVEVVRCRDCKFWNPYRSHHYKGHYCDVVTLFVQENEYCAWGKRREEEHDER